METDNIEPNDQLAQALQHVLDSEDTDTLNLAKAKLSIVQDAIGS